MIIFRTACFMFGLALMNWGLNYNYRYMRIKTSVYILVFCLTLMNISRIAGL